MPILAFFWIWLCAYLNCAGWALSALHQLNAAGYGVALLLGVAALVGWSRRANVSLRPNLPWPKYRRRFRRPFPLAFLSLAALALLGGLLHPPTNYDALAYRIPRIFHWLDAGQWHWIHTIFPRLNNRSCGIEWVSAPIIALAQTIRPLFLLNFVSLLLLPGLVFSLFTRLGVPRRTAWHWMWIVPTGYCFLLQAGSIGNDLFGAPFALAAVVLALRAKSSGSPRDFFTSILAAALMTSAKTSSLPLLLPWAIALLPTLTFIWRRPLVTAAVCGLAVFASALPTMVQNQRFAGDWSGAGLNRPDSAGNKIVRTVANVFIIPVQNLAPPVFPLAGAWKQAVNQRLPAGVNQRLHEVMLEPSAAEFTLPELQMEEGAGLGFGVTLLLLVSCGWAKCLRQSPPKQRLAAPSFWLTALRWSPAGALLVLMTTYNLSVFCRVLTPYYALLMPLLLADPRQAGLVHNRWWRAAAYGGFLLAAGLLIISPARPLFPVMSLLKHTPQAPARLREVYSVYAARYEAFAPAVAQLPAGLKTLGLVSYDDPETSLWLPLGNRRLVHVCPEDSAAELKAQGVEYILIQDSLAEQWLGVPLTDWLQRLPAQVVRQFPLNLRAAKGPQTWDLVKLN